MLAGADGARARPGWQEDLLARMDILIDAGGLTTGRMARRTGVSAAHLTRSFRRHVGCTPSAYLNRRRLARAADLLVSTRRGITDIAADLGFASRSHFNRAFCAEHGTGPQAWRQRRTPSPARMTGP